MIGERHRFQRPVDRIGNLRSLLAEFDGDAALQAEEEEVDLTAHLEPHPGVAEFGGDQEADLGTGPDGDGTQVQTAREVSDAAEQQRTGAEGEDDGGADVDVDERDAVDGGESGSEAEREPGR